MKDDTTYDENSNYIRWIIKRKHSEMVIYHMMHYLRVIKIFNLSCIIHIVLMLNPIQYKHGVNDINIL
jgi:hypothetical protein